MKMWIWPWCLLVGRRRICEGEILQGTTRVKRVTIGYQGDDLLRLRKGSIFTGGEGVEKRSLWRWQGWSFCAKRGHFFAGRAVERG